MTLRPIVCVFALLSIALIGWAAMQTPTFAEEKAQSTAEAEFDDKVVTIYFGDPSKGRGQILTDVSLMEIGGRMMLVGTGVETGHERDWTGGVRIGVAWDSIVTYYAMTQSQYEEKMKEFAE